MLADGVLTRKKASGHSLGDGTQAGRRAASTGLRRRRRRRSVAEGQPIDHDEQREAYSKVVAVALLNASLSRDEFRVLEHLQDVMNITPEEHEHFLQQAGEMARLD